MLPRLMAEEQLRAIDAASLGSGKVRQREARRAIRDLERVANGGRRRAIKATPAMLAAAGIAVVIPTESGPTENGNG